MDLLLHFKQILQLFSLFYDVVHFVKLNSKCMTCA